MFCYYYYYNFTWWIFHYQLNSCVLITVKWCVALLLFQCAVPNEKSVFSSRYVVYQRRNHSDSLTLDSHWIISISAQLHFDCILSSVDSLLSLALGRTSRSPRSSLKSPERILLWFGCQCLFLILICIRNITKYIMFCSSLEWFLFMGIFFVVVAQSFEIMSIQATPKYWGNVKIEEKAKVLFYKTADE